MTVLRSLLRRGAYADSVVLMQLRADLMRQEGIDEAGVVMASHANLDLLRVSGLLTDDAVGATPDDLLIVVRADDEASAVSALSAVDDLLARRSRPVTQDFRPRSLGAALRQLPSASWVLVSVPGRYAARVAREAIDLGRHVFLYSDNVSLDEEIELKAKAASTGRFLLGPDCGTALVQGVGLGFANRVRRGRIGLVAASGTGLQLVSSRIHSLGAGVSQAFGTGGRDLSRAVGGGTTRQALAFLSEDPETEVIAVLSKPPAPEVEREILDIAWRIPKPVVVYFVGRPIPADRIGNLYFARDATEVAAIAVQCQDASPRTPGTSGERGSSQGLVRGLFGGGTLAIETWQALQPFLGDIASNWTSQADAVSTSTLADARHCILDLGADDLTTGRLHPMIDPTLRLQLLEQVARDPRVSTVLVDVILGDGADPEPMRRLAPAVKRSLQRSDLDLVVLLVGTDEDPQDLAATRQELTELGAAVYDTVAQVVEHVVDRLGGASSSGSAGPTPRLDMPLSAINVGLESFFADLMHRGVEVVHVDWRPPAGGREELMSILERMKS